MDEFVRRYADNVSAAGLFLRTKAPKPTGTKIRFELLLSEGTRALRGEGVVVAIRSDDKPGMSLRFNALDAESQALIDRIVSQHGNGSLAPTPLSSGIGSRPAASRAKTSATWRSTRGAPAGWQSVRSPAAPPAATRSEAGGGTDSALPRRRAGGEPAAPPRRSVADRPWANSPTASRSLRPTESAEAPSAEAPAAPQADSRPSSPVLGDATRLAIESTTTSDVAETASSLADPAGASSTVEVTADTPPSELAALLGLSDRTQDLDDGGSLDIASPVPDEADDTSATVDVPLDTTAQRRGERAPVEGATTEDVAAPGGANEAEETNHVTAPDHPAAPARLTKTKTPALLGGEPAADLMPPAPMPLMPEDSATAASEPPLRREGPITRRTDVTSQPPPLSEPMQAPTSFEAPLAEFPPRPAPLSPFDPQADEDDESSAATPSPFEARADSALLDRDEAPPDDQREASTGATANDQPAAPPSLESPVGDPPASVAEAPAPDEAATFASWTDTWAPTAPEERSAPLVSAEDEPTPLIASEEAPGHEIDDAPLGEPAEERAPSVSAEDARARAPFGKEAPFVTADDTPAHELSSEAQTLVAEDAPVRTRHDDPATLFGPDFGHDDAPASEPETPLFGSHDGPHPAPRNEAAPLVIPDAAPASGTRGEAASRVTADDAPALGPDDPAPPFDADDAPERRPDEPAPPFGADEAPALRSDESAPPFGADEPPALRSDESAPPFGADEAPDPETRDDAESLIAADDAPALRSDEPAPPFGADEPPALRSDEPAPPFGADEAPGPETRDDAESLIAADDGPAFRSDEPAPPFGADEASPLRSDEPAPPFGADEAWPLQSGEPAPPFGADEAWPLRSGEPAPPFGADEAPDPETRDDAESLIAADDGPALRSDEPAPPFDADEAPALRSDEPAPPFGADEASPLRSDEPAPPFGADEAPDPETRDDAESLIAADDAPALRSDEPAPPFAADEAPGARTDEPAPPFAADDPSSFEHADDPNPRAAMVATETSEPRDEPSLFATDDVSVPAPPPDEPALFETSDDVSAPKPLSDPPFAASDDVFESTPADETSFAASDDVFEPTPADETSFAASDDVFAPTPADEPFFAVSDDVFAPTPADETSFAASDDVFAPTTTGKPAPFGAAGQTPVPAPTDGPASQPDEAAAPTPPDAPTTFPDDALASTPPDTPTTFPDDALATPPDAPPSYGAQTPRTAGDALLPSGSPYDALRTASDKPNFEDFESFEANDSWRALADALPASVESEEPFPPVTGDPEHPDTRLAAIVAGTREPDHDEDEDEDDALEFGPARSEWSDERASSRRGPSTPDDVALLELTGDDPFDVALGQALNEELFDAVDRLDPGGPRQGPQSDPDEDLIDMGSAATDPADFDDVDDNVEILARPGDQKPHPGLAPVDLVPLWPKEADPDGEAEPDDQALADDEQETDEPEHDDELTAIGEELKRLGAELTRSADLSNEQSLDVMAPLLGTVERDAELSKLERTLAFGGGQEPRPQAARPSLVTPTTGRDGSPEPVDPDADAGPGQPREVDDDARFVHEPPPLLADLERDSAASNGIKPESFDLEIALDTPDATLVAGRDRDRDDDMPASAGVPVIDDEARAPPADISALAHATGEAERFVSDDVFEDLAPRERDDAPAGEPPRPDLHGVAPPPARTVEPTGRAPSRGFDDDDPPTLPFIRDPAPQRPPLGNEEILPKTEPMRPLEPLEDDGSFDILAGMLQDPDGPEAASATDGPSAPPKDASRPRAEPSPPARTTRPKSTTRVTVTGVPQGDEAAAQAEDPPAPPLRKPAFRPAREQQPKEMTDAAMLRPLATMEVVPFVEAPHARDSDFEPVASSERQDWDASPDASLDIPVDFEPEADAPALEPPPLKPEPPPTEPEVSVEGSGVLEPEQMRAGLAPPPTEVVRAAAPTLRPTVAIDIGGRWAKVGLHEAGEVTIVPAAGQAFVPALVAVRPSGQLVVGAEAHTMAVEEPSRVISVRAVLRALGEDGLLENRAPRGVSMVAGEVAITVGPRPIGFDDALQSFLELLRGGIVQHLDNEDFQAMLTVPHDMTAEGRRRLETACVRANIAVARIVSEADALIQAYGLDELPVDHALLVDLGATHLSVAVARRRQGGLAVVKHRWFDEPSGHTFDDRVAQMTLDELARQVGTDHRDDPVVRRRLTEASERARGDIRRSPTVDLRVFLPVPTDAEPSEQTIRLGRMQVYQRVEPLVAEVCRHAQEVLRDSGLDPRLVGAIAMAGSGGTFPPVVEGLSSLTLQEPLTTALPTQAYVVGAARMAVLMARHARAKRPDTLQAAVGIELPGGRFRALAPTGSSLPLRLHRSYPTTRDNQAELEVKFYQGYGEKVSSNTFVGSVVLRGFPKGLRGELIIELDLQVDKDGVLTVSLSEPTSNVLNTMRVATQQTPEERRVALAKEAPPPRRGPEPRPRKRGLFSRLFGRNS